MTISQLFILYGVCGLIWFIGGFYVLIMQFHGAFTGKRVAISHPSQEQAAYIAKQVRSVADKLRMHPNLFTTAQRWTRIVRYAMPSMLLQGLLWFIPVFNLLFRKRYIAYVEEVK